MNQCNTSIKHYAKKADHKHVVLHIVMGHAIIYIYIVHEPPLYGLSVAYPGKRGHVCSHCTHAYRKLFYGELLSTTISTDHSIPSEVIKC